MIHPIHIYGSPVLHSRAKAVTEFDESLAQLVEDMWDTTIAAPGVGLAAPQIGLDMDVFVWVYADQPYAPAKGVAINPTLLIEPIQPGEPTDLDREGCLSFPGYKFPIRRSAKVLLRAQDIDGHDFELEVGGWFARIIQHEYDHLQGTIYVDRLSNQDEIDRIKAEHSWGRPGQTWTPETR